MKNLKLFGLVAIFMLLTKITSAQITKAIVKIDGVHCVVCAKNTQENLSKLPFVKDIEYDIVNKEFIINIIEGVPVDIYHIQKSVYSEGQSVAKLVFKCNNMVTSSNHIKLNNDLLPIVNPSLESSDIQIIGKDFVSKVDFKKMKKDYPSAYKSLNFHKLKNENFAIVLKN